MFSKSKIKSRVTAIVFDKNGRPKTRTPFIVSNGNQVTVYNVDNKSFLFKIKNRIKKWLSLNLK